MFKKYKTIMLTALLAILFGLLPNNFITPVKASDSKTWLNVGTPGFTSGIYPILSMTGGTPYVAALNSSSEMIVMKYNGSNWEQVGNIPTIGCDIGISLYVDNGIPYISFCDCGGGNQIKVSVMKYNNGNWESIGTPNFSSQYVSETSICVYGGVPYVSFIDIDNKITLEKYTGGSWTTVGGAQFAQASYNSSLAIYNGIPYVSFRSAYDGTGKLMKYSNNSWQTVGNPSISYPSYLSLAIDSDGTPYFAYTDETTKVLGVKKFYGGSWQTIGNAGSLGSNTEYDSISVYNGTPYVSYQDGNNGGVTLITYNKTKAAWETVGSAGFSGPNVRSTSSCVDNGTPYVVFSAPKLTVMKYANIDPPTISPASGTTVSSGTLVTLTSSTPGADIYYTLDGSPPTVTKTHYTSGITINTPVTIRAIAAKDGVPSASMSATYKVNSSITPTSSSFDKYSGSSHYADINVNMALNGNTLSDIKNGATSLTAGTDYVTTGSAVTIKKAYLEGLANGTVNLTFTFNAGANQSLNLTVGDSTPANSSITPTSSSFDKCSSSSNYTDINVNMTLNGNTLSNIKNGTTSLTAETDYVVSGSTVTIKKEYLEGLAAGTVNLTFSFNAGANQSLNLTISDTTPGTPSITPASSSFDKYSGSLYYIDINVDMTLNGNTLSDIKNGATSLTAGTDYVTTGSAVTIKKAYLEGLAIGTVNLTFYFNAGSNQSLNLTISDTTPGTPSITPASSSFDKYSGSLYYIDINVDMTLNGNTLSDIKNGATSLTAGTDYVVSGSTVTIKKEYLEGLAAGTVNLTFSFNAGANQSLNLTVSDTTPGNSSITPTSSSFDKYSGSSYYTDVNVAMTLNGNTLSDIKNGTTSLTAGTDYVVSGSTVTIKKEYLEGLAAGTVNLTFSFNAGANQSLNLTVSDTTPGNSSITPTSSSFDKYSGSSYYTDINVDMTLNGNTLSDIKNGTTSLTAGTDYVVSGNTVTIKKEYLEGLATGTVNLTFSFNAGANQSLNLTVSDTTPGNSSITPTSSSFDKYSGSSYYTDINVDMTLNGNTLSDIKNGTTSLTAGTDYVVSGNTVTIKKEYLERLATGNVNLTFYFNAGNSQTLVVTIADSATAVAPTITTEPTGQAVTEGQNVSFSVTATGTTPLSYQWKKNGADISGANLSTLSLNNVQLSDAGSYQVVVSNTAGSVTSSAVTLTVSLPYIPDPTPTPQPSTEVIAVPVTDGSSGNTVSQTVIERTTQPDGTKKDDVIYATSSAQETVDKLKKEGKDTARIVVPDVKDEVSEVKVGVPKATIDVLAIGDVNVEIGTENGRITIPKEAVKDIAADAKDDLYFRVVPIKGVTQQAAVEERAKQEEVVRQAAGNSGISVVGRPMTIETNMKQTRTFITLPLRDVVIPSDPVKRQAFLNSLAVFVEHSDATKELLKGEVVDYKTGVLGLRFPITKYSTFTIIKMDIQNSTINPASAEFDKNTSKQADLNTALTLNGNSLVSIKNGDKTLVSGTDYAATSEGVTIKKEYLAQQSTGTVNLTFNFSAGISQTLTIAVKDTTSQNSIINPTTASFDKNTSKQADVSTSLELKGNTLVSIANGTKTLVNGTDYVITNGTVTIKKEYLAAQSIGTTTLTFNFSDGNTQALVITIKDTTPSSSGGSGGSGGGTSSPSPAPVPEKNTIERIYGQDRISTAIAIAKATYKDKVSKVILAASDNYPDALAGSVLAYKEKAPILLVGKNAEEQEKVIAYMKENMNSTGSVYILGGIGSVSKDMENKVITAGFSNISRIGGADRYETASKIADTVGIKEGTPLIIVSGDNYPDAISVSSIAAVKQYPIFMVNKDEIAEVVKKEISTIKPGKIYIIGLQGAVSKAVEDNLSQSIDKTNLVRIGGSDRFETSLNIAKYFNLSGTKACVASGNDFPDALAGSNYAANSNSPIILVDNSLTEEQKTYLKNDKIKEITIFGGTGAVTNEVENVINELIKK